MDILDMIAMVSDISQFDDNASEEQNFLSRLLKYIKEFIKDIDMKNLPEKCLDESDGLREQMNQTKVLLQEYQSHKKQNKLLQKFKAILPGNILNRLKEQNEKLKNSFDQFEKMYILCQSKSSVNLPLYSSTINQKSMDPTQPNEIVMLETQQNHFNSSEDIKQLKISFEIIGDETIIQLIKDQGISTVEERTVDLKRGPVDEAIAEFGRRPFLPLVNNLKIISMISGKHTEVYFKKEKEDEEEEENKEKEKETTSNELTVQVIPPAEDIYCTVNEDVVYSQKKNNKPDFKFYIKNFGGNGTSIKKQNSGGGISENVWVNVKDKSKEVEIENGDCFGILADNKTGETLLGYIFSFEEV